MEAGVSYAFVNMDFAPDYRASLTHKFNWPTFPVVVKIVDGKEILIGGYEQLKESMK
tara:strand:- start:247 stop:417 length:171 start_codon:yes stop_codon:yes gene_type:complete